MLRILSTVVILLSSCLAYSQSGSIQPVTNVTTGVGYESIAEAISAASSGDHISLAAFQFTEHISIHLPLTITGSEVGTTLLDVSQEDGWGITLSSDDITLKNMSIIGGGINTAYAIHSEPGITGLTIEDISVFDSHRTCLDLNGLTGPGLNTLKNISVSGSSIGFGIAMSSCSNMLVENITSSDNGYGDIAIMESNYYSQEIQDVVFAGSLDLEGPQNLGGGGIIVQVSPAVATVGSGFGFDISINAEGFDYLLEAPGDLTGCILVHEADVKEIAATLGANVAPLVSYDLATQHMIVFEGMSVQSAIDAADEGAVIEVKEGTYDSDVVEIDQTLTLLGANAGNAGEHLSARLAESNLSGIMVTGGHPTVDGFRISSDATGVEVTSSAAGITLRNSVIAGLEAPTSVGVRARQQSIFEYNRIEGFNQAAVLLSGDFTLASTVFEENATGLVVNLEENAGGAVSLSDCPFGNVGGTGILVLNGGEGASLAASNSTFGMHTNALDVQAPIELNLSGNTFSNSENHILGLDRDARIALCGANAFDPALRILGCTDLEADNFEPCATLDQGCQYWGCTSPKACNYDLSANVDDGSCDFISCSACPLGFACNYDPDAALYRVDACEFSDCGAGMATSNIERGNVMVVEGCTIPQACNYDPEADAEDGSCSFDCYGCTDALACNYDQAFTQDANETCLFREDLFNSPNVDCNGTCFNDINENGVCDEEEISGCMDDAACNFLPAATLDDGACDFASCAGCTNPAACNHDINATISDGSCDYASCGGCTDPAACNYDSTAAINDGSCTYPVDIHNKPWVDCDATCLNDADGDGVCDEEESMGCTDSGACNYEADATDDDGTCEYASCAGCTDPSYCNFNPGATLNDGSCAAPEDLYPGSIVDGVSTVDCLGRCINDEDGDGICDEAEIACPGDLNGDGLRGASDILVMLSAFGCLEDCGLPDLNGDGLVSASDVLQALSTFGVACPQ